MPEVELPAKPFSLCPDPMVRSTEFLSGFTAGRLYASENFAIKCPHQPGTASFDAFLAGASHGVEEAIDQKKGNLEAGGFVTLENRTGAYPNYTYRYRCKCTGTSGSHEITVNYSNETGAMMCAMDVCISDCGLQ